MRDCSTLPPPPRLRWTGRAICHSRLGPSIDILVRGFFASGTASGRTLMGVDERARLLDVIGFARWVIPDPEGQSYVRMRTETAAPVFPSLLSRSFYAQSSKGFSAVSSGMLTLAPAICEA